MGDGRPFWRGRFSQPGNDELLFYHPGDGRWWLGTATPAGFTWTSPGSTSGLGPNDPDFGQVWDGRPFWAGDFDGDGRTEILFYFPGDGNWWIGDFAGTPATLTWSLAGNTMGAGAGQPNFGQVADGRPFWQGRFSTSTRDDVAFYFPGDGNWWVGTFSGLSLGWNLAGNTLGQGANQPNFGQVADGRPFHAGDFDGDGRTEIVFYFPGDGNWWIGNFGGSPATLGWNLAGNTLGQGANQPNFGQVADGRPFWTGRFSDPGRDDIAFYFPGDGNWWVGTFGGSPPTLGWNLAGNTLGQGANQPNFGQIADGRPIWIGDFTGPRGNVGPTRSEVLFYFPGDGNWWIGDFAGTPATLTWSLAGNTMGVGAGQPKFGQVWDGRPFWTGRFLTPARDQILFYFPGDGNWWLGSFTGTALRWAFAGNTGRPFNNRLRLHVKIVNGNTPTRATIATMVANFQQIFATGDILVEWASTENLTLPFLSDVSVSDSCTGSDTTDEQDQLFVNRNGAAGGECVAYFVRSTSPPLNGCAQHPSGAPGVIVTSGASQWTLAHEAGHVADLDHVAGETCPPTGAAPTVLMTGCGTGLIVGTPTLSQSEISTVQDSDIVSGC